MRPYYEDESVTLFHGDNREVLAELPSASVDSCVTDPPYELAFMGRKWDASGIAYDKWLWAEVWRVLKPGGHLLAFGGTRTWHRLAVAIEDAGFDIRDSIAWMYGSGFPKSLDVSKAIDKAAGAERKVVSTRKQRGSTSGVAPFNTCASEVESITAPATSDAATWQGWGTALKPAFEPVVVARKPLQGTVAENVLRWGTGALNIDGSRIQMTKADAEATANNWKPQGYEAKENVYDIGTKVIATEQNLSGRWPANVILDESQAAELDRQSGVTASAQPTANGNYGSREYAANNNVYGAGLATTTPNVPPYGDMGGASRFFYVPKANSHERPRGDDGTAHPTVKPVDLMRYLVKLVTPPGGTVLEPFAGSGSTLEACIVEGFKCVGIELTDEYLPLIVKRVTKPIEPVMF